MKISTKGRYGLRALVELTACSSGQAVPLLRLTETQTLSQNYLEQVFQTLRKAGIVTSIKGMNGGYLLARAPEEITVREVLEALEGKFSIIDRDVSKQPDALQTAVEELVWDEINRKINTFLESRTLAQLAEEYQNKKDMEAGMYYI